MLARWKRRCTQPGGCISFGLHCRHTGCLVVSLRPLGQRVSPANARPAMMRTVYEVPSTTPIGLTMCGI